MPIPSEPSAIAAESPNALGQSVFDVLGRAIADGILVEGEALRERDLERWMGVSRTPIREALARLAALGLVEISPSRYTRVTVVDDSLIKETLEFVGFQSGLALRLAVPRMSARALKVTDELIAELLDANDRDDAQALIAVTRRLNAHVADHVGNRILRRVLGETRLLVERNLKGEGCVPGTPKQRREWFEKLRDAVRERDGEYAEYAIRGHHELDTDPQPPWKEAS
ncbi:GntR family transcriptional regulator [Microbacterium sp. NPDC091382]|uniref:GntR family transcriptional regulator n=1 Tax=Microbacterium sp. NPDC091382 TaxID=3364210 RepID=UPI00381D054D